MIIIIQTLRLAKLILSASAAMASALPHIYSKSQQIQVHVKIQIVNNFQEKQIFALRRV